MKKAKISFSKMKFNSPNKINITNKRRVKPKINLIPITENNIRQNIAKHTLNSEKKATCKNLLFESRYPRLKTWH